jgi:hypothetical protein
MDVKNSKITCDECNGKIMEYYNEHYRGNRGKCLNCGIDFPLE